MQAAVLEAAAEEVLNQLGHATGQKWQIADVVEDVPNELQAVGVTLSSDHEIAWRGVLSFDSGLRPLVHNLLQTGTPEYPFPADGIHVTAGVVMATVVLPVDELESIRTGDVIVLDGTDDERAEYRLVFGDRVEVRGTVESDSLQAASVSAVSEPQLAAAELKVELSFDCGSCSLATENLRTSAWATVWHFISLVTAESTSAAVE